MVTFSTFIPPEPRPVLPSDRRSATDSAIGALPAAPNVSHNARLQPRGSVLKRRVSAAVRTPAAGRAGVDAKLLP